MAYIEIRVSGLPKLLSPSSKPNRERRVFRGDSAGVAKKNAFVAELRDVRTKYDLRYLVDGRLASETFDTKKAAEARRAVVESTSAMGTVVDPSGGRQTVDEVAERWLKSNPGKRASTLGTDKSILRTHIRPRIGHRQLRSIRQSEIQEMVTDWSETLMPRTVHRNYATLRAIFQYAVDSDIHGSTPCRKINLPRVLRRNGRLLTPVDVTTLAGVTDARYAPMVWTGALLGLRWGEVAGLRIGALDQLDGSLTVREVVTRDEHGRPIAGPPKSEAGNRTVAMPQSLIDCLASHLASNGLPAADQDALVFPAPKGGRLSYANFRTRVWEPATTRAGLDGVGFHDLRRLAGTQLFNAKVDLKTIEKRMGHSDVRLTLDLYAQATSEGDRHAANQIDELFAVAVAGQDLDRISMMPSRSHSATAS